MSDSNLSRKSRLEQKLTKNQFLRSSRKLNFRQLKPKVIDIEPFCYLQLILLSVFDIKKTLFTENVKYPLAILLFGAFRMSDFLEITSIELPRDKIYGTPYGYVSKIENGSETILGALQSILLNLADLDRKKLNIVLKEMISSTIRLAKSLNIDINHLFYLSIEFYKDVPFWSDELDLKTAFTRLQDIRNIYLKEETKKKQTRIELYLEKRFNEEYK